MSKIIESLNPEIAAIATRIGEVLEIDQDGIVTIPGAAEVFAETLPEGLSAEQVEQSIKAINNWHQGVAAATTHAVACEAKDQTEIGQLKSFAYADTVAGTSFELALNIGTGEDPFSEVVLTGQVSHDNTTNGLFAHLAASFTGYVKGE